MAIVHDEVGLRTYFETSHFDTLAQEYAPGHELGVFYYRYPGEERGRILSITDKRIPEVEGDGKQTLERLILNDPRAVCMADHYLEVQADAASRIPQVGERVPLVELGTHCRGAIFLDGSRLRTAELVGTIDRISREYHGFFFGRYDLRVPDLNELKHGRGFKILELNGVTSEATHIYDPAIGLAAAYRVLFRQWRIAFEIGAANRGRGVPTSGPMELLRLLAEYRRSSRSHPG